MRSFITAFCALALLLSTTSCNQKSDLAPTLDLQSEQLYNAVKREMQISLNLSLMRSNDENIISDSTTSKEDLDSALNIVEYLKTIKSLYVTETTKSFLYNLPLAFIETENCSLALKDIDRYAIPNEEKELLIKAIAMVDAIKESHFYTGNTTRTADKEEYHEALNDCVDQYYEDLGIAVGEAVLAGGIGAYGGPVAAGVACAATGVWKVGVAYYKWRKCKSKAEELL